MRATSDATRAVGATPTLDVDLERLATAMAAALASWWRRHDEQGRAFDPQSDRAIDTAQELREAA